MSAIASYFACYEDSDPESEMMTSSNSVCVERESEYSCKLCDMCSAQEAKYKCPGCGILTCSLVCCKEHKFKRKCSGRRDRAGFIGIKEYAEKNLRSGKHS